jgi:hypothetical protein
MILRAMQFSQVGWVATLLLAASAAWAQSVFTTSYAAAPECPTEDALRDAIASRVGADSTTARPVHFHVEITARSSGYVALAQFDAGGGKPVVRQIVAPDCAQALEGIALVCALAIGAKPAGRAPRAEPEPEPPPAPRRAPRTEPIHSRGAVEALVAVAGGFGPRLAPGIVVAGRVAPVLGGPALRLSTGAFDGFEVERDGGAVRFQQLYGRLDGCVNQPFPSQAIRLDPCLGFEAGFVFARGIEDGDRILEGRTARDPWLALAFSPGSAG